MRLSEGRFQSSCEEPLKCRLEGGFEGRVGAPTCGSTLKQLPRGHSECHFLVQYNHPSNLPLGTGFAGCRIIGCGDWEIGLGADLRRTVKVDLRAYL